MNATEIKNGLQASARKFYFENDVDKSLKTLGKLPKRFLKMQLSSPWKKC